MNKMNMLSNNSNDEIEVDIEEMLEEEFLDD